MNEDPDTGASTPGHPFSGGPSTAPAAREEPVRPALPRRRPSTLGDFSGDPARAGHFAWALPVGGLGAGAAWVLLRLIGLITNLVFFGRSDGRFPRAGPHPWWLVLRRRSSAGWWSA